MPTEAIRLLKESDLARRHVKAHIGALSDRAYDENHSHAIAATPRAAAVVERRTQVGSRRRSARPRNAKKIDGKLYRGLCVRASLARGEG